MDYEFLRNYAINYYLRYYPSRKKFEEKLLKKSGENKKKVKKLLKDLDSLIIEKEVIEGKIRFYIGKNKNLSYIKNKLFEKGFEKQDYEEILENKFDLSKTFLDKNYLKRKIFDYKEKNKSKKYIFSKLYERKEDKEIILDLIDEIFLENGEFENLKNEYNKLKQKYEKNKIIEKLMRKGFNYSLIKKLF